MPGIALSSAKRTIYGVLLMSDECVAPRRRDVDSGEGAMPTNDDRSDNQLDSERHVRFSSRAAAVRRVEHRRRRWRSKRSHTAFNADVSNRLAELLPLLERQALTVSKTVQCIQLNGTGALYGERARLDP